MRTGAPLANTPIAPRKPYATPTCALLEITACCVSPPLSRCTSVMAAADNAHRRSLGEYADRTEEALRDADLRAVGDHGLLGLAAAVGIENVEREIVAFEQAGLVADLGDEGFANAAPADCDL